MKVFVYGTLKRGERAAFMMAECRYIGKATIKGTIYHFGHFPGIKLNEDDEVYGEVYELPSDKDAQARIIDRLDRYEGVPTLYRRKQVIATIFADPHPVMGYEDFVQTYEYVPDVKEEWRISSGIFTTIPEQERKVYG